jgi:hypothetical protein
VTVLVLRAHHPRTREDTCSFVSKTRLEDRSFFSFRKKRSMLVAVLALYAGDGQVITRDVIPLTRS